MSVSNKTLKYRPEIDGLRAISILPVIFFHAGFNWASGGFIGVDIFFLISGYLITSMIIHEAQAGNFSLANFYERRARRILPALFTVLLACMIPSWMIHPDQFLVFSDSLISVVTFSSNIFFYFRSGGYFWPPGDEYPLLHTWSLAVEEQFYVLFPAFIIIAWKFTKNIRKIAIFIFFILLISITLSEYLSGTHPKINFYLLPSRSWELLSGSILAIIKNNVQNRISDTNKSIFDFIGFILMITAIALIDSTHNSPNALTALPLFGASTIILFSSQETFIGKLLSNKLMVKIGLISYSLYLWH
ncbi:MAG: acyltransferase [Magnetococcus sp. DMHC-1]|nr:acyltransferase [Magnetococcales bacterium]